MVLAALVLFPTAAAIGGSGLSSRRSLLAALPLAVCLPGHRPAAAAADAFGELLARLDAPLLSEVGDGNSMQGRPEPRLPTWLAGRWRCEQTLTGFTTPLGVQYIGAPGRPLAEAEASAAQTRAQIGKPIAFELRFDAVAETGKAEPGAVEARAFNARSRLDAFAGRPVTRTSKVQPRSPPCVAAA